MLGRYSNARRRCKLLRLERLEERVTPDGFVPSDLRHAYGFDLVAPVMGTALTGAGQTIAIVDAYYDPYAASDLKTFDTAYNLPAPPSFQQVSQTGGVVTSIAQNPDWGGETALDIEWAHAIAPGANIMLVEATSQSIPNLMAAVGYARSQPGVSVVSMSFGFPEFANETSAAYAADLSTPTAPAGHVNVSFVAASGDYGAGTLFPSISPNVLAVGGTSLFLDSSGNYSSESAWDGSGGGTSQYFTKPTYQTAYNGAQRAVPDVSYVADPYTGVSVYNTYDGGFEVVGGTSDAAPQWSGLIALADQGRSLLGLSTLDGTSQLLPDIYSMPSTNFNDITTGSNGYNAGPGYDLATGLGSPKAQLVIGALIGNYTEGSTTPPVITQQPTSQSVAVGQSATFTAAATGNPTPSVSWQVSTDGGLTFGTIIGATSATYTTGATVATENGYEYRAVFSNAIGAPATTNAVILTVGAPGVTTQPTSQTVTVGQTATFTAAASGSPAPSVQWQVSVNGGAFANISGATSATYSFVPVLANSGEQFRAVFTNSTSTINTNAATLTVVAPVTVAAVQVGDGTSERSEVQSITVTFSGPVNFAGGNANAAAAFQLLHIQTGNNVLVSTIVSKDSQGRTVVTLYFTGGETDPVSAENGGLASLADGRYTLTINSASVTDTNGAGIDGDGNGAAGGNYVSPSDTQGGGAGQLGLFRLFGDTNGDGVVDQLDLGQFRAAFNSSAGTSPYVSYLDADNNGYIDQVDLGQFRSRLNANVF